MKSSYATSTVHGPYPPLYYDSEKRRSDASSLDGDLVLPDYKTNGGMDDIEGRTMTGSQRQRHRQMFSSLVQYLIWRRPSQDDRDVMGHKQCVAGRCVNALRRPASDHGFGGSVDNTSLDCIRDGGHSVSTSVDTGGSANGADVATTATAAADNSDQCSIKDELAAYMEEIRMREIKLEYELGRGRLAI